MCYPMGVFWTRTIPSFICTHDYASHVTSLQMSLHSLCLLFMRSLVLRILLCIPRCFHLLHDGTMNLSSGLDTTPWQHSSWTGLPFLLSYFFMAGRFCINDVTTFIIFILCLEMSSLVLRNKSSFFFACRWLCMRSFLQVKCICMVRTFHKEYSY